MAQTEALLQVAWSTFVAIATSPDTESQPLVHADSLSAIRDLVPSLCGLNLIQYDPQSGATVDVTRAQHAGAGAGAGAGATPQASAVPASLASAASDKRRPLVEVCDAHEDTGLLTFGVCGPEPGLVILDRELNRYVRVEELGRPGSDLFVFMGKKLPMFVGKPAPMYGAAARPGRRDRAARGAGPAAGQPVATTPTPVEPHPEPRAGTLQAVRELRPTPHAVLVRPHVPRTSVVFLLDVAKQ